MAVLLAFAGTGCSSQTGAPPLPPDTRAADEAAIRAATQDLEKVIEAKDLDRAVSGYEDDAVLFLPKAPAIVGKAAIRKAWQGLLAAPGVKMTTNVSGVDVARSGDLAVERGTYRVVTPDKEGKSTTETGQLVVVWKKQSDGTWKVFADTNSDDK